VQPSSAVYLDLKTAPSDKDFGTPEQRENIVDAKSLLLANFARSGPPSRTSGL